MVEVSSVVEALETHSTRYLDRVFTPGEVADSTRGGVVDPARLAARFAAKEATMKALHVGDAAVPWRDVEVVRAADGSPSLHLTAAALELANEQNITGLAVSLTHEQSYAAAIVVAEVEA
jgi:holo-[acyl-carrier protein] synthase